MFAAVAVKGFETGCPELWHFDAVEDMCRPDSNEVELSCTGDLVTISLNNQLLRPYSDITVNSCNSGVEVIQGEDATTILIIPEQCESEVIFDSEKIVLRNTVNIMYGKHDLKIPFDCLFHASASQEIDSLAEFTPSYAISGRRRRSAIAQSSAVFDVKLDYYDDLYEGVLPDSRRLIVGENAHVLVGLKQKIAGIEMAVTNCTVFDDEFSQSYSVIDYPRCADSIVNAEIRVGSDQWENRISYKVFEFVNEDMTASLLKLVCRVILCDANLSSSECKMTCGDDTNSDGRRATLHAENDEN